MRTARRILAIAILPAAVMAAAGGVRAQDADAAATSTVRAAMLETLGTADAHGLGRFGAGAEALSDEALTARTLGYARAQLQGQVAPSAVRRDWHEDIPRRDPEAGFADARAEGALAAWLADLPPPDPRYEALRQAYDRYHALTAEGGWSALPDGPTLREGDAGPQAAALRTRLAAEGFVCGAAPADPALFDASLDCAVRAFQELRGLDVDGAVGPQTRAALNVPAARRARQIEANLERWRWLPRDWPARRIEVNTGGAEAALYRDGAEALRTRIIAGKPSTPTPTFNAAVQGVVINPPWVVPASIARNELLPREAREPGYLARNQIARSGGQLIQAPGEHNSLGRIKLDMPNPYTVYLHDTPVRALFDTARRYYSHGCMRMQHPREMATLLLQAQGWTREAIDAAIEAGETRTVALDAPVPVYVYHHTAWVRDDGALVLHPDVYGWDAALLAAIDGARVSQDAALAAGETECALVGAGPAGAG